MNNPGQLLDSGEEPVEHIEKKWLVPLVICIIAFGYLSSVLEYIVPSVDQFERNIYSSLIVYSGYLIGGVCYIWTNGKIFVIYTGFLLLLIFCFVASWFISKDMNISWTDASLYGLGSGMTFYPLLTRFLKASFPYGRKQNLFVLLIFMQTICIDIIDIRDSQFIQPENTGFLPIAICFGLFLFAFFFMLLKSLNSEKRITEDIPKLKKKFPSYIFIPYLVFTSFIIVQTIVSSVTLTSSLKARNTDVIDYFNIGSTVLLILVAAYLITKRKFTCQSLFKIGLITSFLSLTMYLIVALTKKMYLFHDYFTLVVDQLFYAGLTVFGFGITVFLIQRYQHKYFSLLIAIPSFIGYSTLLLLLLIRSEETIDFFIQWHNVITISNIIIILFFFLYLNRKTKTLSDEQPDRYQS